MEGSMDRIAIIDEEMFVTGSDNGSLSLWVAHKKKPIFTLPLAHGINPPLTPEEASAEANPDPKLVPAPQPCWITALTTIPYSDVILSGSWDGHVRAWKVSGDKKRIEALGIVGLPDPNSALPHRTPQETPPLTNGFSHAAADPDAAALPTDTTIPHRGKNSQDARKPIARGVINDISVFERGERGKDGVCIVVALGKEHRLGRWAKVPAGKNGALVFEVPKVGRVNGVDGVKGVVNGDVSEEKIEDGE
jgi:ribosomal RNA-processing protein 9